MPNNNEEDLYAPVTRDPWARCVSVSQKNFMESA
jgi:hypothetical protein